MLGKFTGILIALIAGLVVGGTFGLAYHRYQLLYMSVADLNTRIRLLGNYRDENYQAIEDLLEANLSCQVHAIESLRDQWLILGPGNKWVDESLARAKLLINHEKDVCGWYSKPAEVNGTRADGPGKNTK